MPNELDTFFLREPEDNFCSNLCLPSIRRRHIDLSGLLYFGGVEPGKRERASAQGVTSKNNLEGCLRDLTLDGRQIGLPDVKETSGVVSDCVWSFRCLTDPETCSNRESCVQVGTDRFHCECTPGDAGCEEEGGDVRDTTADADEVSFNQRIHFGPRMQGRAVFCPSGRSREKEYNCVYFISGRT
jgi:hypothetical protein